MRVFLLIILFSLLGCAADLSTGESEVLTPDEVISNTTEPAVSTEEVSLNAQALDLINFQRQRGCRCGSRQMPAVPGIRFSARLATAADLHSRDMRNMNSMQHAGSDGSGVGDRVTRQGYRWRAVGENIARGHRSIEQVVQAWFDSPGHCENLMSADYTEFGMARADFFWTQVFARPR